MNELIMNQGKKILEYVFIAIGNVVSWASALFGGSLVAGVKDVLAIVVSLATLVLIIHRIVLSRMEIKESQTDE